MLKIRLTRRGKKRQPSYRVVVADAEAPRDGRFVESIGYYNPLVDPVDYKIQEERALYWLSVGAQPTDAVRRLLSKQGTLERLPRVHQGEAIDALAAEYYGVPLSVAEVVEEAAPVAEVVTETEAEAEVEEKDGLWSSIKEKAADVAEDVGDFAESVVDKVQDLVDGDDAEEVADAVEATEDAADDSEVADDETA
jgi:small subunit ribosomal protein S16